MQIVISKEIKVNGYNAFENWMFTEDWNGRHATHYVNNRKGTYYKKLSSVFFETKEDGNEFYLRKIKEGFKR